MKKILATILSTAVMVLLSSTVALAGFSAPIPVGSDPNQYKIYGKDFNIFSRHTDATNVMFFKHPKTSGPNFAFALSLEIPGVEDSIKIDDIMATPGFFPNDISGGDSFVDMLLNDPLEYVMLNSTVGSDIDGDGVLDRLAPLIPWPIAQRFCPDELGINVSSLHIRYDYIGFIHECNILGVDNLLNRQLEIADIRNFSSPAEFQVLFGGSNEPLVPDVLGNAEEDVLPYTPGTYPATVKSHRDFFWKWDGLPLAPNYSQVISYDATELDADLADDFVTASFDPVFVDKQIRRLAFIKVNETDSPNLWEAVPWGLDPDSEPRMYEFLRTHISPLISFDFNESRLHLAGYSSWKFGTLDLDDLRGSLIGAGSRSTEPGILWKFLMGMNFNPVVVERLYDSAGVNEVIAVVNQATLGSLYDCFRGSSGNCAEFAGTTYKWRNLLGIIPTGGVFTPLPIEGRLGDKFIPHDVVSYVTFWKMNSEYNWTPRNFSLVGPEVFDADVLIDFYRDDADPTKEADQFLIVASGKPIPYPNGNSYIYKIAATQLEDNTLYYRVPSPDLGSSPLQKTPGIVGEPYEVVPPEPGFSPYKILATHFGNKENATDDRCGDMVITWRGSYTLKIAESDGLFNNHYGENVRFTTPSDNRMFSNCVTIHLGKFDLVSDGCVFSGQMNLCRLPDDSQVASVAVGNFDDDETLDLIAGDLVPRQKIHEGEPGADNYAGYAALFKNPVKESRLSGGPSGPDFEWIRVGYKTNEAPVTDPEKLVSFLDSAPGENAYLGVGDLAVDSNNNVAAILGAPLMLATSTLCPKFDADDPTDVSVESIPELMMALYYNSRNPGVARNAAGNIVPMRCPREAVEEGSGVPPRVCTCIPEDVSDLLPLCEPFDERCIEGGDGDAETCTDQLRVVTHGDPRYTNCCSVVCSDGGDAGTCCGLCEGALALEPARSILCGEDHLGSPDCLADCAGGGPIPGKVDPCETQLDTFIASLGLVDASAYLHCCDAGACNRATDIMSINACCSVCNTPEERAAYPALCGAEHLGECIDSCGAEPPPPPDATCGSQLAALMGTPEYSDIRYGKCCGPTCGGDEICCKLCDDIPPGETIDPARSEVCAHVTADCAALCAEGAGGTCAEDLERYGRERPDDIEGLDVANCCPRGGVCSDDEFTRTNCCPLCSTPEERGAYPNLCGPAGVLTEDCCGPWTSLTPSGDKTLFFAENSDDSDRDSEESDYAYKCDRIYDSRAAYIGSISDMRLAQTTTTTVDKYDAGTTATTTTTADKYGTTGTTTTSTTATTADQLKTTPLQEDAPAVTTTTTSTAEATNEETNQTDTTSTLTTQPAAEPAASPFEFSRDGIIRELLIPLNLTDSQMQTVMQQLDQFFTGNEYALPIIYMDAVIEIIRQQIEGGAKAEPEARLIRPSTALRLRSGQDSGRTGEEWLGFLKNFSFINEAHADEVGGVVDSEVRLPRGHAMPGAREMTVILKGDFPSTREPRIIDLKDPDLRKAYPDGCTCEEGLIAELPLCPPDTQECLEAGDGDGDSDGDGEGWLGCPRCAECDVVMKCINENSPAEKNLMTKMNGMVREVILKAGGNIYGNDLICNSTMRVWMDVTGGAIPPELSSGRPMPNTINTDITGQPGVLLTTALIQDLGNIPVDESLYRPYTKANMLEQPLLLLPSRTPEPTRSVLLPPELSLDLAADVAATLYQNPELSQNISIAAPLSTDLVTSMGMRAPDTYQLNNSVFMTVNADGDKAAIAIDIISPPTLIATPGYPDSDGYKNEYGFANFNFERDILEELSKPEVGGRCQNGICPLEVIKTLNWAIYKKTHYIVVQNALTTNPAFVRASEPLKTTSEIKEFSIVFAPPSTLTGGGMSCNCDITNITPSPEAIAVVLVLAFISSGGMLLVRRTAKRKL